MGWPHAMWSWLCLSFYLLPNVPPGYITWVQVMIQVPGSLPFMWETYIAFQPLGCSLVQPLLLQALVEATNKWNFLCLPFQQIKKFLGFNFKEIKKRFNTVSRNETLVSWKLNPNSIMARLVPHASQCMGRWKWMNPRLERERDYRGNRPPSAEGLRECTSQY